MALQTVMNGRPTEIEAKRIVEFWRTVATGEIVPKEKLWKITGLNQESKKDQHHFQGVLNRARKMILEDTGVCPKTIRGEGWQYPTGGDQLRMGTAATKQGVRKMVHGAKVATAITDDRLSETEIKARDFVGARLQQLAMIARDESRKLSLAVGTPKTLPNTK